VLLLQQGPELLKETSIELLDSATNDVVRTLGDWRRFDSALGSVSGDCQCPRGRKKLCTRRLIWHVWGVGLGIRQNIFVETPRGRGTPVNSHWLWVITEF
jgi:hypothetical protein